MDEMTIVSDYARGAVSKLLSMFVKIKTGANIEIDLKPFRFTIKEKVRVHLELDAEMSKEDFDKLISMVR